MLASFCYISPPLPRARTRVCFSFCLFIMKICRCSSFFYYYSSRTYKDIIALDVIFYVNRTQGDNYAHTSPGSNIEQLGANIEDNSFWKFNNFIWLNM